MIFLAKRIQDILFWYLQYSFFFCLTTVQCFTECIRVVDIYLVYLNYSVLHFQRTYLWTLYFMFIFVWMCIWKIYIDFVQKCRNPCIKSCCILNLFRNIKLSSRIMAPVYVPIRREFPCGITLYPQDWRQSTSMIATPKIRSGSYQSLAWHFPNG